jgi:hypothetical protein
MGGKKFRFDEEVQQTMHEWLCRQPYTVNAGGPILNKMETVEK